MNHLIFHRFARRAFIASPLLLATRLAWAFPVEVEIVGTVALGESPKLIFEALETAHSATVKLKRDDGQTFTFNLGNLELGQRTTIALDARPARHSYQGVMTAVVEGQQQSSELTFKTVVARPIELHVDRTKLNLAAGVLVLTSNATLATAQLIIFGADASRLLDREFDLSHSSPNVPITLNWSSVPVSNIVRIELRVTDQDGFFKGVALTPWSLEIPHEEVLFASNSAAFTSAEEVKLRSSLNEIQAVLTRFSQIRGVQLFIAGHTDTMGAPAHNANLSRLRAQAIGQWFVRNGVPLPVYFEGFGESNLKVKTADEVDEPQNRRVDYILSVELPLLKSVGHSWKRLK